MDEINDFLSQLVQNKIKYFTGLLPYTELVKEEDILHQKISNVIKTHDPIFAHLSRSERKQAVATERETRREFEDTREDFSLILDEPLRQFYEQEDKDSKPFLRVIQGDKK